MTPAERLRQIVADMEPWSDLPAADDPCWHNPDWDDDAREVALVDRTSWQAASDLLERLLGEHERNEVIKAGSLCEHGVEDGEYCKPCQDEYRRAYREYCGADEEATAKGA